MPLRFEGCRERLRRAKVHRENIAVLWKKAGKAEELYNVVVDMDDDGAGCIWLKAIHQPELINALSLELGEMLYQLRAALDGCIYQAAIFESKQNPPPDEHRLEFPVCISPKDFEDHAFRIGPLSPERRDIVEFVQPYKVPKLAPLDMVFNFNRAIEILGDWARKDRHRRLHVVGSWVVSASPKLILPIGVSLDSIRVAGSGFLEEQGKVADFRLTGYLPGMEIKANPDLAIDIAINEIPPPCADNDTLGNRLLTMLRATYFVVTSLEHSF
jgi:hypothetical protein